MKANGPKTVQGKQFNFGQFWFIHLCGFHILNIHWKPDCFLRAVPWSVKAVLWVRFGIFLIATVLQAGSSLLSGAVLSLTLFKFCMSSRLK